MSKQINFYAIDADKILINEILLNVFGQLIDVPYQKGALSLFDPHTNKKIFYLAEENRKNNIFYRAHEYHDDSTAELLDYRKSPVIEYSLSSENIEGHFTRGRFYCCSDDVEFSKKVSRFITNLKKEFWYVKKWKTYISKNIDVGNSLFYIPNRTVKITKEDLQ